MRWPTRLHISITKTKTRENYLVFSFPSGGAGKVSGWRLHQTPFHPVGQMVTIPPFPGRLDISLRDKGQLDLYINIANQDIPFRANWVRLNQALFPSSKRMMESLYQHGPDDG
ncbi:patatin-like phospholipase domain-containing protein 4 [Cervus canadensis]|uniref:patatin-like phospholipase domain-containing protein 4 n=1 Tax=Cervus canadensis TaxID=1574408 RepID=UPI001CA35D06|nr:patatin-like phospholipase domain-containing protein 4 [Cervus canadensis]